MAAPPRTVPSPAWAWNATKITNATNTTGGEAGAPPSLEAWLAFQVTITTNTTVVLACLLVFGLAQSRCAHVYKTRWTFGVSHGMIAPAGNAVTWVWHTLSITNDQIFRHAGLDALAITMLVEMALQLFVVFMVLNTSVLMFGFGKMSIINFCFGDDRLWGHWSLAVLMVVATMGLIRHHWHEFSTNRRRYMLELRDACTPTQGDLTTSTIPILALHGRAVVVDGVPRWINHADDPDQALYDFFERMFPGQVDSAVMYRDPGSELTELLEERDETQQRYESALASRRAALDKGKDEAKYKAPTLSVRQLKKKAKAAAAAAQLAAAKAKAAADSVAAKAKLSSGPTSSEQDAEGEQEKKEDSTRTVSSKKGNKKGMTMCEGILELELAAIERKLGALPAKDVSDYAVFEENCGFVVFFTSVGRATACQMMLTTPWDKAKEDGPMKKRTAPHLKITPAPEPRDLIHENIGKNTFSVLGCIKLRALVFRIASYWLLFFWLIPVTAIAALTQLDVLEKYFPFISVITSIEVVRGFLTGFLPTFALVQFMSFLPKIFAWMAKSEGKRSWTEVDEAASQKYIMFQIINVLFVSALAGGIIETFDKISQDTYALISILGEAMPGQYFFFTSYIMLLAFGVYPLELVQAAGLVLKKIKMKRATGARAWTAAASPPLISGGYAKQYGYIMLAFAISMEFATLAPMILPFSVIFFCVSSLVLRHHIYYMYDTKQEGMGRIWPWLMFCICAIMIICLLTLLGVFFSRQSVWQGILMWPVIGAVAVFYHFEAKKHALSFTTLSLQEMKKSENTRTKRLDVQVSSQSYAWMVNASGAARGPYQTRAEINRASNVSVNMPAAHAYLHPAILRHRLGALQVMSAAEEKRAYQNIQKANQIAGMQPHSKRADTLRLKKKVDVSLFGKTFVAKSSAVRRSSFRTPVPSPLASLEHRDVDIELADASAADASAADALAAADPNIQKEDSTEAKGEEKKVWWDITAGMESGALPLQEQVEEETAIFLFRSRGLVWLGSMGLAISFIVGTFGFYADHIRNEPRETSCPQPQ